MRVARSVNDALSRLASAAAPRPPADGHVPPVAPAAGRWFGTLKVRLMVASTLVIAASVAVTTSVVLQRVQARSEQALMDLESDSAERMAGMLGARLRAMLGMLQAAAAALPVAAQSDADAAAAQLAQQPALMTVFAGMSLAAADGRVLAMHDGKALMLPALNVSRRSSFARAMQGVPNVSPPFMGAVTKQPAIVLAVPVLDAQAHPVGVLSGWVQLTRQTLLDDLTQGGHADHNGVLTVVTDATGTIVSHPQRQHVLQPIASEPGLAATAARWVSQGRPLGARAVTAHADGRFVSMVGVPDAGWMVFRLTADAELLGGLAQAREWAVWWAGGVALAGGLLLLALLTVMLGPLSKLRQRALRLKDPTLPIEQGWPAAGGEIGELSRVLQQVLGERAAGEQAKQVLVQQMGSVLAAAPIGIAFTRERRFELAGAEFSALLGWPDGALAGCLAQEIFASEQEYAELGVQVGAAFAVGRPYFGEMEFRRRDGRTFWGRLQGRPVDPASAAAGTIWLLEDVTERRQARERLSWSASHDTLTRLCNRGALSDRLAAWLAQPQHGLPAALLFIDLDRFKHINDNAGHAAGDAVLRDVAAVLQAQVRAGDTAARLGGDEFALFLPGCVATVAQQLGERLRTAIARLGVEHGGRRLGVDASIGVVELDAASGASVAAWLAHADSACYAAKHAGGGCVRIAAAVDALCLTDSH